MSKTILARSLTSTRKSTRISSSFAKKIVFRLLHMISDEHFVIIDNGESYVFGKDNAELSATLEVHNPDVYAQILLRGDIALGEAYMRGDVCSPNIVAIIRVLVRQQAMFKRLAKFNLFTGHITSRLLHKLRKNSITGSKKNITAHYDLGNDFFKTFLDPTMMYSSAIYENADTPLVDASQTKLRTICESLNLSEDDHVLEIGTGWGGFAAYAAEHYGCKVTTTTISQEQYNHASALMQEKGLSDRVTVLDKDYRELTGTYDKLVSIEMIEAVGHQYLPTYVEKINKLLKPNGTVLLQAIMMPDQKYERAKYHADFIKTHIFPGGFLPSMQAILAQTQAHTALNLVNYLDITQSYAYTLRDWRQAFDAESATITEFGYPESFQRLWRFYLAYCEGGFSERAIYCAHITLQKNGLL